MNLGNIVSELSESNLTLCKQKSLMILVNIVSELSEWIWQFGLDVSNIPGRIKNLNPF